jgi:hypothetical protein
LRKEIAQPPGSYRSAFDGLLVKAKKLPISKMGAEGAIKMENRWRTILRNQT